MRSEAFLENAQASLLFIYDKNKRRQDHTYLTYLSTVLLVILKLLGERADIRERLFDIDGHDLLLCRGIIPDLHAPC